MKQDIVQTLAAHRNDTTVRTSKAAGSKGISATPPAYGINLTNKASRASRWR